MEYEAEIRTLADKVGGLDKLRNRVEDLSWSDEANDYWANVVACLTTFHGQDEATAQAQCAELRAILEEPIPGIREEDDFKWLYMHEEPCYMADSVSRRNGGHTLFQERGLPATSLTDDNLKLYIKFRDE